LTLERREIKIPGKDGDGKIFMDIKGPISPKVYSCEGKQDGYQLLPYPTDCLHFFACAQNETYRIKCPVMHKQTYFNPEKGLCDGRVEENYCITHAGNNREELIEKTGISWEVNMDVIEQMEEVVEEQEEEFTVVFDTQDEDEENDKTEL